MTGMIYCKSYDKDFKIEPPKCPCHSEEFIKWRKELSEKFANKK